ncbi:MAG: tetratricopeptide repeat protein [Gemmatimonadota bacterium]|nr:tetratricopeptide repeat protein [Gemmatimonadota bacterium]
MSPVRPTVQIRAAESPEVKAIMDEAKKCERDGRWPDACRLYETLIRNSEVRTATRLGALRWLARAYLEQGNRQAALDVLEAAVAAAEQSGSSTAVAQVLNIVGIAHQTGGDLDNARAMYEAAREKAESTGDAELLAMIDQNLGSLASIRGETREALESFRRSQLGYQTLGMRNHEAQLLNNLGLTYADLGEFAEAEQAYAEAARAFAGDNDQANQLTVAINQVQLSISARRFDEAVERSNQLLSMGGEQDSAWQGEVFRHVGVISRELGNHEQSADYLARAAAFAERTGDLLLTADVAEQTAELYWVQKRHRDMLISLNKAYDLYSRFKAQHRVAQVEKRNAALESRFIEIARDWGTSVESKDHYTQGHCERVAFFSTVLADSAGFNARELFWIRIGALLHDIGKIIVPAEVLNKPGKLDETEWLLMRRHPEAGLDLVADIDFPGDIRSIIRNHHERWDGTGYPDRIGGEEIPLAARILCVADVYDALTTTRSYRPGMTHARAAEIMRDSPGQFDLSLLDLFLDWAGTANIPGRPTPERAAIFALKESP